MLPENLPEVWLLECFLPALYIHVHCIVYICSELYLSFELSSCFEMYTHALICIHTVA